MTNLVVDGGQICGGACLYGEKLREYDFFAVLQKKSYREVPQRPWLYDFFAVSQKKSYWRVLLQ